MERELQALLDARPGPEAERLLAVLPPADRREARRWLALARAARALPAPAPSPEFVERTEARLARLAPPRPRATLARRLLRWTPVCAAAAASVLAVAVSRVPGPAPVHQEAVVRLALAAPGAREVHAAGDFNRWRPEATPLHRDADGLWRAEISVPPGRGDQYMLVVDGDWVTDPAASARVDDGFGRENGLLPR